MDLKRFDRKEMFARSDHEAYYLCVCYGDNAIFFFVDNDTNKAFNHQVTRSKPSKNSKADAKSLEACRGTDSGTDRGGVLELFKEWQYTAREISIHQKCVLSVEPSTDPNSIQLYQLQNARGESCWGLSSFGDDMTFRDEGPNRFHRITGLSRVQGHTLLRQSVCGR